MSLPTAGPRSVARSTESNGVRTVIVERADRLARDLMVQEVIVGQFSKIGARILTADGVDLTNDGDDPTRRLIRQVLGAVSEFDKRVTVLKLRAARERKRARGERVEGVKPFGHFPAEQHLIEHMRQLRRKPRRASGCPSRQSQPNSTPKAIAIARVESGRHNWCITSCRGPERHGCVFRARIFKMGTSGIHPTASSRARVETMTDEPYSPFRGSSSETGETGADRTGVASAARAHWTDFELRDLPASARDSRYGAATTTKRTCCGRKWREHPRPQRLRSGRSYQF